MRWIAKRQPTPESLEDLRELIAGGLVGGDYDAYATFGGEAPHRSEGVFSWDRSRVLIGSCPDSLEIVDRDEWERGYEYAHSRILGGFVVPASAITCVAPVPGSGAEAARIAYEHERRVAARRAGEPDPDDCRAGEPDPDDYAPPPADLRLWQARPGWCQWAWRGTYEVALDPDARRARARVYAGAEWIALGAHESLVDAIEACRSVAKAVTAARRVQARPGRLEES